MRYNEIIEELSALIHKSDDAYLLDETIDLIKNQKSEAIREFAENLKGLVNQKNYMISDVYNSKDFGMFTLCFEQAIDEIVTQMTEDKNA